MIFYTDLEFYDGETIKDIYLLLGNSKDYIINKKGIGFEGIEFLFKTGKTFNYFFRMDYDVNMIINNCNLSNKEIIDFFNNKEIKIKDYTLQYFRNKILIIRKGKEEKVFYDVFNFFNTSFVKVMKILELDKKFKTEYNLIKQFKLIRNVFTKKMLKKIIEYNKTECLIGLEIVKEIYRLLPEDLKTLKLYGASSITNIYLRKNEIDKKINLIDFNFRILKDMFFGGRMEAFKIGLFKDIYKYDINSAYPYIISKLKVIKSIEKVNDKEKDKIVETDIYFIEMEIKDLELIGLLPIRLKSGLVVYPNKVKGYYYGAEVRAVDLYSKKYNVKYRIVKRFKVNFENIKLFNDIELLYNLRLKYKKKNDKRNLIYKILLNSIYGKFAQKIGKNIFNNYYYAGLITSSIRAKLLIDFVDYAKDIIFIATDGVLTLKENLKLKNKINNKLGNYELIKIKKGYVILSGIYYLEGYNNKIYTGQRGFHIDYNKVIPAINEFGNVKIIDNVFITLPFALKNYKSFLKYKCKIIPFEKELNIKNQLKRIFLINKDRDFLITNYNSLILTNENVKLLNKIKVNYLDIDFYFDFY